MQSGPQDLMSRAVEALGGADKMSDVKTLWAKATVRQWEPEQSMVPGGEMRFACESTVEVVLDVGARAGRADWVRNFAYPFPRTYTFSEIVTPDAGYVAGIDALLRTKQSLESNPPAHTMSGLRLATVHREMRRSFLLGEMVKNPDRISSAGDVTVGGGSYPAVEYRAPDQAFIVMFDRATGLPARVRTLDYDNIWGDVTYDLVFSDWLTTPDGRRVATTNKYELNGRTIMEVKIIDGKVNVPVPADRLTIPDPFKAGAPKPASGPVPYQWVIRRQFIGTYLDSDVPSYDTRATSGLRARRAGARRSPHRRRHAPQPARRDARSPDRLRRSGERLALQLGAQRREGEVSGQAGEVSGPLAPPHGSRGRSPGVRRAGATIVVGKGNGDHFRRVLAAPFTRNPDLAARDLSRTELVEVADKRVLTDGQREIHAYLMENPHANGFLLGYVPDARLGFIVDIWNPGAAPLPEKITPPLAALVAGVKKAGIQPLKFAGGHGSVADYAPLAALEGK